MNKEKLVFEMFKNTTPVSVSLIRGKCTKLGADYVVVTNMLIEYQGVVFGGYFLNGGVNSNVKCKEGYKPFKPKQTQRTSAFDQKTRRHFDKLDGVAE